MEKFLYNLDAVNPGARKLQVSAKTGEGVDEWREWLVSITHAGHDRLLHR